MTLTSHLVSARERGKRMLSQTRLNASMKEILPGYMYSLPFWTFELRFWLLIGSIWFRSRHRSWKLIRVRLVVVHHGDRKCQWSALSSERVERRTTEIRFMNESDLMEKSRNRGKEGKKEKESRRRF